MLKSVTYGGISSMMDVVLYIGPVHVKYGFHIHIPEYVEKILESHVAFIYKQMPRSLKGYETRHLLVNKGHVPVL